MRRLPVASVVAALVIALGTPLGAPLTPVASATMPGSNGLIAFIRGASGEAAITEARRL